MFTLVRSTEEAPSFSPAASPRVRRRHSSWPPLRPIHTYAESSPHPRRRALLTGPDPPGSSRLHTCGDSTTGSPTVTPSHLACRTRPVWQYRTVPALSGLLPPSPAPPGSGCPQLRQAAATAQRRRSCTSPRTTKRLMAHEPPLVRHRHARLRSGRLDANARLPDSQSPPLGTQTATTTPVLDCRTPRPTQPPNGYPPRPTRRLDPAAPRRDQQPSPAARPRITPSPSAHPETAQPRKWNRRPPTRRRTKPSCPKTTINPEPPHQHRHHDQPAARERSGQLALRLGKRC